MNDKAMSNQLWVSPARRQGLFVGFVQNGELTFAECCELSNSLQMAFEYPSFTKHSFFSSRKQMACHFAASDETCSGIIHIVVDMVHLFNGA